MKYPIAKGVFDILPEVNTSDGMWRTSYIWQYVEGMIRKVCSDYGYHEIRTPIFERTELFVRGVGESSDIVSKEMYTFEDKGGRSMTLRPEGTACIMRAFVEKRLDQLGGVQKLYSIGPMFRYERPQAGRYRQHHQLSVEAIGLASPEQDVELIDLMCTIYRSLGLTKLCVQLNSVGDAASRQAYRDALRTYLEPRKHELSEESQIRYEKNVLRILDSKNPYDQKLLENAPTIDAFLSDEAKEHFAKVQSYLKKLNIPFEVNPKIVRGLDYYTKTVFEVTAGELGAQNAIGAGGRYDGLVRTLGGPELPGVGFATGLERVIQTMLGQGVEIPSPAGPLLFIVPVGDQARDWATEHVFLLRHAGIHAEIDWNAKKVGTALQQANRLRARYALVIGDDELQTNTAKVKELSTREEISIALDQLSSFCLEKQCERKK